MNFQICTTILNKCLKQFREFWGPFPRIYSRTPLIRTLVIRISNYSAWFGLTLRVKLSRIPQNLPWNYQLSDLVLYTVMSCTVHCYVLYCTLLCLVLYTVMSCTVHCYGLYCTLLWIVLYTVMDCTVHCYGLYCTLLCLVLYTVMDCRTANQAWSEGSDAGTYWKR
jgi:hypothetical protein